MIFFKLVLIGIGATFGAWIRWLLGNILNPLFPSIPMGTLAANLIGGYLIGVVMGLTRQYPFFPEEIRLAITTGFLGGLTTFSTFSAETVSLLSYQQYTYFFAIIILHVAGSIFATILGIMTVKTLA